MHHGINETPCHLHIDSTCSEASLKKKNIAFMLIESIFREHLTVFSGTNRSHVLFVPLESFMQNRFKAEV